MLTIVGASQRRVQYLQKLRQVDSNEFTIDSPLGPAAAEAPSETSEQDGTGAEGVKRIMVPADVRIKEYKMRNLRVSQMRRSGIPAEAIRAADEAARELQRASSAMERTKDEQIVASEATDR